jgi:hypothetical protein
MNSHQPKEIGADGTFVEGSRSTMKSASDNHQRHGLLATTYLLCALLAVCQAVQGATLPPQVEPPKKKTFDLPPLPPPPPPLKIKSAPAKQVIVPGLQPGKVIGMTLEGGKPPIQIAIDAGTNSQFFSVAHRPTFGKNLREPTKRFQPGAANSLSSADELMGIRYAGVASNAQVVSQIPVTIRASDSGVATVTASMVVFPLVPELKIGPNSFNNVIARQPITVDVQIERLPAGVGVSPLPNRLFENLTVAETNCFFLTNRAGTSANADLSGRATFHIEGTFGVRNVTGTPKSCTFAMEFTVGGYGVGSHTFLLKKGNISLVAPVTYTLENTNTLKSLLKFSPAAGIVELGGTFGTCSGTSYGIPSFEVGIVEEGNDLAFTIRSGLFGTGCEWRSRRLDVDSGLRLIAMNWEITKAGSKCCSGALSNCEPQQVVGTVSGDVTPIVESPQFDRPPFYDGGGAAIAAGINGSRPGVPAPDWGSSYFTPMTVRLRCDPTVVNDHGITLRLNSVRLEGPPGRKFP